jgi:uncharacterized protein (DUF305 family)
VSSVYSVMSQRVADAKTPPTAQHEADDELLLPWYFSWWRVALISAALTAGLIGFLALAIGGRSPGADSVDVGFLQDMRHHHDQAVTMSLIYKDNEGTNPLVRQMADEVLLSQAQGTGIMVEVLRGFGAEEENSTGTAMTWMGHGMPLDQMTGMASSEQLDALRDASGLDADRLFITLMTAHHQGGVEMAEYASQHASTDRVDKMATTMERIQRTEIEELAAIEAKLG